MICYDYTAFQIIKSECESQTQFICHFCPLNSLFNFAAWVGFYKKFKSKLRHRPLKGANGRIFFRKLTLVIYPGTLLHNGLPDILLFTDIQIDKRKDKTAVNGTKEVIRGRTTRVEPLKDFTEKQSETNINSSKFCTK